jgi:hypothetical protein
MFFGFAQSLGVGAIPRRWDDGHGILWALTFAPVGFVGAWFLVVWARHRFRGRARRLRFLGSVTSPQPMKPATPTGWALALREAAIAGGS